MGPLLLRSSSGVKLFSHHPQLDEYKVTILGLTWCLMHPLNLDTWLLPVRFWFNVNVQQVNILLSRTFHLIDNYLATDYFSR